MSAAANKTKEQLQEQLETIELKKQFLLADNPHIEEGLKKEEQLKSEIQLLDRKKHRIDAEIDKQSELVAEKMDNDMPSDDIVELIGKLALEKEEMVKKQNELRGEIAKIENDNARKAYDLIENQITQLQYEILKVEAEEQKKASTAFQVTVNGVQLNQENKKADTNNVGKEDTKKEDVKSASASESTEKKPEKQPEKPQSPILSRATSIANLLESLDKYKDIFCKTRGYTSIQSGKDTNFVSNDGKRMITVSDQKISAVIPEDRASRNKVQDDALDLYVEAIKGKTLISHRITHPNPEVVLEMEKGLATRLKNKGDKNFMINGKTSDEILSPKPKEEAKSAFSIDPMPEESDKQENTNRGPRM